MEIKTDLQIIAYQLTQVGLQPKLHDHGIRLKGNDITVIITNDSGVILVQAIAGGRNLIGQLTTDIYKATRLAIQYIGE